MQTPKAVKRNKHCGKDCPRKVYRLQESQEIQKPQEHQGPQKHQVTYRDSRAFRGSQASRGRRLGIVWGTLLAIGVAYTFIIKKLHIGLCCPFERLTGFLCPGCGISSMFLNLFQGDLQGAFYSNSVTFCMLPALTATVAYLMYRYVKYEDQKIPEWMNVVAITAIIVYLIWGIVRNVPGLIS